MKAIPVLVFALLATVPLLRADDSPLETVLNDGFDFAAKQYTGLVDGSKKTREIPRSFEAGKVVFVQPRDWTSGFFAGSLWFLFEHTQDPVWKARAADYTARLESEKKNRGTHDVGFILFTSFGQGYRLTHEPHYRDVLVAGAESLATRFDPKVGLIKSWDRRTWRFPVIIDNMMNLELLMWASHEAKKPEFARIASSHADLTLKNHYRSDGSSFHLVAYNPEDGSVEKRQTHQGFADQSAWARGQAWGLYGYTMMFRETKNPAYLEQAKKIAHFILSHPRLPADKVPYWDFDANDIPRAPRDASAAAVVASALIELSGYVDAVLAKDYLAVAEIQVRSLSAAPYRPRLGENGHFILQHSVGNMPQGKEIDVPINYADYYYLEALSRFKALLASRK
jgi:unsaturated chondroitin disaccharide hydrolase